ncbi:MAG: hypothetical protein LBS12_04635 [Prevotellaceae bacterium]|jgi:hypothetical protein|nr:hypothetical protein [Prevotellaceae bacterium]
MKRNFFLIFALWLAALPAMAQATQGNVLPDSVATFPRNELKVNLLLLFLPALNVEYEYLLNDESAIGVSAQARLSEKYYLIPYEALGFYRFYFGKKPAAGFFMEISGGVYAFEKETYYDPLVYPGYDPLYNRLGELRRESHVTGCLGATVGGKFLTKRNVVVELYLGFSRSLAYEHYIPRMGITLGKRF